jgi:hypothetical protein
MTEHLMSFEPDLTSDIAVRTTSMSRCHLRWFIGGLMALVLFGPFAFSSFAQTANSDAVLTTVPVTGLLQWQQSGLPIATADGNQRRPQLVTDGAGGALVVWEDYRPYWSPSAPADLYAQRVSADGQTLWQQDGILVAQPGNQTDPHLISDGQGGAIVVWADDRTGRSHIYAQRITGNGTLLWNAAGIQLSSDLGDQYDLVITSDQTGGAIVAWTDYNESQHPWPIVYVQRIQADGTLVWPSGGVTVTGAWHGQFSPQVASDGTGGAIVVWVGDCTAWVGLCVQRVLSDGQLAWGPGGVTLGVSVEPLTQSQLLADGAGGATVVWVDYRHMNADIYAQRIMSDSTTAWAGGGVPVIVADGDQQLPLLVNGSNDGNIISWYDDRVAENGLYLQFLDSAGQAKWNPTGVPITRQSMSNLANASGDTRGNATDNSIDRYYDLAPDGADGALITWWGTMQTSDGGVGGVWLQRVITDGVKGWTEWGALIQPDLLNYGVGTPRLLNEGIGGAIIVWEDNRRWFKVDAYDIYAQRVIEGTYQTYLPRIAR